MSRSSSCQEFLKIHIYALLKIALCLFHPNKNVPTVFFSRKISEIFKLESVERSVAICLDEIPGSFPFTFFFPPPPPHFFLPLFQKGSPAYKLYYEISLY